MESADIEAGEAIIADAAGEAVAQLAHGGAGEGEGREPAATARTEEASVLSLL